MKIIALGSFALSRYLHNVGFRKPKDLDVLIHFDDLSEFMSKYQLKSLVPRTPTKFHGMDANNFHYEVEVAGISEGSSANLLYGLADTFDKNSHGILIPPVALLYHIKMSHRFKFSPHFEKTRNDIFLLKESFRNLEKDCSWVEFLKVRKEEAYKETPKLKGVSKDQFFMDVYGNVPQIVHDTIHLTQAFEYHTPAYTHFQVGEVECSMKKFFEVDEQIRLNAVFEESATLAIERSIWPSKFESDEFKSFKGSLQRLCCHISSGKFRTFAWENYDKVLAMYQKGDIVKRFKEGLQDGTVQFQEENFDYRTYNNQLQNEAKN